VALQIAAVSSCDTDIGVRGRLFLAAWGRKSIDGIDLAFYGVGVLLGVTATLCLLFVISARLGLVQQCL
jgi:hypothetical protein